MRLKRTFLECFGARSINAEAKIARSRKDYRTIDPRNERPTGYSLRQRHGLSEGFRHTPRIASTVGGLLKKRGANRQEGGNRITCWPYPRRPTRHPINIKCLTPLASRCNIEKFSDLLIGLRSFALSLKPF